MIFFQFWIMKIQWIIWIMAFYLFCSFFFRFLKQCNANDYCTMYLESFSSYLMKETTATIAKENFANLIHRINYNQKFWILSFILSWLLFFLFTLQRVAFLTIFFFFALNLAIHLFILPEFDSNILIMHISLFLPFIDRNFLFSIKIFEKKQSFWWRGNKKSFVFRDFATFGRRHLGERK